MANYTPQAGDVIIPGAQAATELLSKVGGAIAGCGQASLAVINGLVNGTPPTPAEVTQIILDSIQHGAGPTGVSTPAELQATASKDLGFSLQSVGWQQALSQDAGVAPIILGVSNARAFGGSDSNVQGHYVTIVGKAANGNYIVSDPNSAASVNGGFVEYSASQIASANPFWAGIPGTAWGSTQGAIGGAASALTNGGLGQIFDKATSNLTTGLKYAGWFLLALAIIVFGALLLFQPQISAATDQARDTAGKFAEAAALGA